MSEQASAGRDSNGGSENRNGPETRPRGPVWKDVALGLLALAVLLLGAVVLQGRSQAGAGPEEGGGEEGEARVFAVNMDREGRSYLEVLFDQPLGEGRVGEVVSPAPATLDPAVGGVWSWRDTHALRFEPSGAFAPGTRYRISLVADRLTGEDAVTGEDRATGQDRATVEDRGTGRGYRLAGETELTVATDPFLVERVDVRQEPALEGGARNAVVLRGELTFSYPVVPEELAPRIRLEDPVSPEPVEVELETRWQSRVVSFRSGVVEKRPRERQLELVIDGDLTSAQGNLPLAEEGAWHHSVELGSSERLTVRRVQVEPGRPDSRILLELSSPVDPSLVAKYLTVERVEEGPGVEDYRLSGARNRLIVSGGFTPGGTYRVALSRGLPSDDDAVLQEPWSQRITLPDLPPSLEWVGSGMFLARSGLRRVAVESVNVPRAELALDRVYLNNLFMLLRYHGFSPEESGYVRSGIDRRLGDRRLTENLELGGERNRATTTTLDLEELLGRAGIEGNGLYRLSLTRRGSYEGVQRWLLLTDLGVVAKRGEREIHLWVSSFTDLSPVPGARVRLISRQNQEIAAGTTDGEGRLRLELPRGQDGSGDPPRPYFLTVERRGPTGEDFTFLLLDQTRVDTSGLDVSGASPGAGGYRAFLYGERDLYRPGETVEGVAVLRDAGLRAPPSMPVVLRHRDPRGRVRDEWTATTGEAGLVELELDLPAYALTGNHDLTLEAGGEVVGSWAFQVEEFVPDRIRVEIRAPLEAVGPRDRRPGPGEELAWKVLSRYLFGPPASGLAVETRLRLVDSTFSPEGYGGWSFRNSERELDEREVMVEESTLGPEGEAEFRALLPAGVSVPSSLAAVLTARVQEAGGRGVTARTRVQVDPYPYYLGLRGPDGYSEPGEAVHFDWVALTPWGEEARAGALRADLYRERWDTVLRRTPSGGYRYESSREAELVESLPVEGGARGGGFELTAPDHGRYLVVLTDPATQASASWSFYASGWGFAPWALENPARVEIDLQQEEHAPGDTAVVQVRSPFPGRLLLTVERGEVLHSQVHALEGNTARLEVPVRGAWRPNVYVTATVVRAAGALVPGEPGRAFGAVPLSVDRLANRLPAEISAPESLRPDQPLRVEVEAPAGARVTVAAVDEGILQLIAQETPDPFAHFYRKLALEVGTHDLFSWLLPEIEGAASAGGDQAAARAQYVRTEGIRRAEPAAFWSGVLTAGADGRAVASFDLAAGRARFQGALRVMAVVLDGRRFGSSRTLVEVRDPLTLLPTVPRVAAPEDRVEVPVTVRNDTGRAGEITVFARAEGDGRWERGEGGAAADRPGTVTRTVTRTVHLDHGAETTLYFPLVVSPGGPGPGAGGVELSWRAEGLGESTSAAGRLPVRPTLPPLARERAGAVREARTELPATPEGLYRPGTVERDLHVGPVPLVRFSGQLRRLLTYPYGCLEQTVSRAFPLIYLEELAARLEPELFEEEDPSAHVLTAIRRVTDLQLHSGAFGLWPGDDRPHPWSTVYATHFLVEAERAGYPVEGFVLGPALDHLAAEARARDRYGSGQLQRLVYSLYVLARAGRPDLGTMDFLRQRHGDELSAASRSLLAAAYAGLGDPGAARELAARIDRVEEIERQTGGNLGSALRDRALLLLALLDGLPEDPRIPELVERLVREAGELPAWTTQEGAFTFLALGRFFQRQSGSGDGAAYAGSVWVGETKVGDFGAGAVVFDDLPPGPVRLEISRGFRPGVAFYALRTRGVPLEASFRPRQAGLEVERRFLDRGGAEVDLSSLAQGDLLVMRTRVRSVAGPVDNVVVENLLPGGLEVENARLATTEALPWVTGQAEPAYVDLRDDRVLGFLDLPADSWQTTYALVRAVAPGAFAVPPVHAEAMYDPALSATGPLGRMEVRAEDGDAGGGS